MQLPTKIETLPIEQLIPYARNSRTHSDEQVAQIAASMREFGFTNPVLIDESDGIIAGHGRVMAARKLGLAEVPCIRLAHLTEIQKRAYVIADNKLALNAGWDEEMLILEIQELKESETDLSMIGFSEEELAELFPKAEPEESVDAEPQIDKAEELRAKWGVEPGQLWELGDHRLLCGDSTNAQHMERLMDGKQADMVFTDPPYGVSYEDSKGRKIQNDELTGENLQAFLQQAFACGITASSPNAPWFVWHASRFQREFENALNDCAITVRQQIIWVKGEGREGTAEVAAPAIGRSDFRWLHEPCFYASPGKPFNAGDRKTTTVWTVTRQTTGTVHPTQKPTDLIKIALENSSKAGQLILDLFGGSGTTIIACEQLGRKCRAIEISPAYVAVALQRWADATGKTPQIVES